MSAVPSDGLITSCFSANSSATTKFVILLGAAGETQPLPGAQLCSGQLLAQLISLRIWEHRQKSFCARAGTVYHCFGCVYPGQALHKPRQIDGLWLGGAENPLELYPEFTAPCLQHCCARISCKTWLRFPCSLPVLDVRVVAQNQCPAPCSEASIPAAGLGAVLACRIWATSCVSSFPKLRGTKRFPQIWVFLGTDVWV